MKTKPGPWLAVLVLAGWLGCADDESGPAGPTGGSGATGASGGSGATGASGGSGATGAGGGTGGIGAAGGVGGTSTGSGGAGGGGASAPSYVPLLTWDFEAGTDGQPVAEVGSNPGDRFTYTTAVAQRGSQAGRVDRELGEPPPECGGNRFYGFTDPLPAGIGQGETIWIRAYFYFPSAMSWGFVYSTGDSADISACGFSGADGWGWTKFLALGPDTGHLRPYLQIPGHRRDVARPTDANGALYLLNSETGGENQRVGDGVANAIPLDEWVAIQWMLYVHDTDGYSRAWMNDVFLGETAAGSTIESASYTHDEWRLGDYWNGFPYTDGAPDRGPFYMDEVILATDKAGYGAPSTVDGGGRPYIAPTTRVSDFGG